MSTGPLVTVEFVVKGTVGLLQHNERLANSFDPITKAIASITSKRKKTEEDNLAVQRLEWEGGLYFAPGIGPYIPGANFKKCLMEAATIFKGGTAVKRAYTALDAEIPLLYPGPRTIEGLWEAGTFIDVRQVKLNGKSRVSRARPRFDTWGFTTAALLNTKVLDLDSLRQYLEQAGLTTGLGDYRPTYGRFTATMEVKA